MFKIKESHTFENFLSQNQENGGGCKLKTGLPNAG